MKFNQIWCVSYSHEWGVQRQTFLAPPPGALVKYHLISITESFFKDFYTKLCMCSHNWKIQNISDGIFILSPGSCPWGGTWGCPGGHFFQTWSRGISNRQGWQAERNASKHFHPRVKLVTLGWGQISLNFGYHVNSKIFITNYVCVLTYKR